MRRLFSEQEGLLGIAGIASDSATMIAAALASLVAAVTAVWWVRGHSRPRTPGLGDGRVGKARLLGNALMAVGLALTVVAGYAYYSEMTDSSRSLPRPVALQSEGGELSAVSAPQPTATPSPTPASPTPTPTPTVPAVTQTPVPDEPTPSPTLEPTSTPVPRTATPEPEPQVVAPSSPAPDRMVIESIGVDSKVQETGTYWLNGELHWQTQPWSISYYGVTGAVGQNGNAAFSGHVATQNYGNVFKDLYKVELGDKVDVYAGGEKFTYVVESIRLVAPTETSVMDPTPDPTITLITCAGDWIEAERNFTERLVVQAKLEG